MWRVRGYVSIKRYVSFHEVYMEKVSLMVNVSLITVTLITNIQTEERYLIF